ncbi:putative RWP-RK domain-containing protein [Phytophthora cinnamomi]|uniref:putative RWP-RK domain-containing protein n=1 Tax=Phytophthora cinnamomi TaxID=4785 RepID=UPI00355A610C|nr:putative RWP-RK domain-containing protein [Phytophthora cinnamomi]
MLKSVASYSSKDSEIRDYTTSVIRYYSSMEPTGDSKEESRRRRRRRSGESVPDSSSAENTGDHTPIDRGSSARSEVTPPEQQQHSPLALTSLGATAPATASPSPVEATASPHLGSDTRRHTGKRRASGEMIHHEEESKSMQPDTPQAGNEIRRPDLPERAVVSTADHPDTVDAASDQAVLQEAQGNEAHKPAVAEMPPPLRVSTRRTTTTTRWSPSMAGTKASRAQRSRGSAASPGSVVTPPVRPISNATRNITFDMLQPHFERPLQQAADSFGVCTTLLKKICRRNGISNWPYRKICGLRKSIASMAKQVNYFDGEQKRAYADQLEKLEQELQSYLRTGNEPTEEFLRTLSEEAASDGPSDRTASDTTRVDNEEEEEEEKEAREVPTWTTRPSIAQPHYSNMHVAQSPPEVQTQHTTPTRATTVGPWDGMHARPQGPPVFPTIATHHRALPSIASILQHQSYSSPSRAASTQNSRTTLVSTRYEEQQQQQQQQQWRYFPPTNGDAV